MAAWVELCEYSWSKIVFFCNLGMVLVKWFSWLQAVYGKVLYRVELAVRLNNVYMKNHPQIHYVGHFSSFLSNIHHTSQIQEEGKIHIWPHAICQKFMHISYQKSIHSSFTLPSLAFI